MNKDRVRAPAFRIPPAVNVGGAPWPGLEEDLLRWTWPPPVTEVMTRELVTISAETFVREALRIASQKRLHHLLVIDGGDLVGVVCTFDLRNAGAGAAVSSCMSTPPVCIRAQTSIREAAERMQEEAIGCLPVVAGGLLVGVITRGDLRKAGLPAEEVAGPLCAACGSHHHVRLDPRTHGAAFCLDCLDRAHTPPDSDDELGTGD